MSDTPRTDQAEADGNRKLALLANYYVILEHARKLERELAAALALSEQRRAMLGKHQQHYEQCPECFKSVRDHTPGCALARLIEKETQNA